LRAKRIDVFCAFCKLLKVLTTELCNVSVVIGIDAELNELRVDDVNQSEEGIVSQWREVSADETRELRERCDEILRPLGYETSLFELRRTNSIALYFVSSTSSAVTSLRDLWRRGKLRHTVESLFTFLLGDTRTDHVDVVKRLNWPLRDYERCLEFFSPVEGRHTIARN